MKASQGGDTILHKVKLKKYKTKDQDNEKRPWKVTQQAEVRKNERIIINQDDINHRQGV